MKNIILKAENISKQYRLGVVGTGTLQHDLNRWWHQVRGKENPYLRIGDINDRSTKGTSDYVWALQDINFEVERGEVLGIIGKNGAGKSTLLKILSKVAAPTTGIIKSRGRISSLLEVGTGFNGEMTGRENIYLNGAILGMTKKEITSKLDEIIDFSGCERYIDTPVKRYSSGMYVRLAFAVAAFLEPDILIIDEVLAVGDAEFQKKAIGKMQDFSRTGERTVLFVSHNLTAIQKLCNTGILLERGKIVTSGKIDNVIEAYCQNDFESFEIFPNDENEMYLKNIKAYSRDINTSVITGKNAFFEFQIESKINASNVVLGFGFNDNLETRIATPFSLHIDKKYEIKTGENKIICEIPNFPLKPGAYMIEVYIGSKEKDYDYYDKGLKFLIEAIDKQNIKFIPDSSQGHLILNQIWK